MNRFRSASCSLIASLTFASSLFAIDSRAQDSKPAISADASGTLIVLNKSAASASLIDLATNKEIAKLPVGGGPHEVAVSPDGKTAVVCNYGAQTPGSSLTVLDLVAVKAKKTIDLPQYRRPHGVEFLSDGKHVAVTRIAEGAHHRQHR